MSPIGSTGQHKIANVKKYQKVEDKDFWINKEGTGRGRRGWVGGGEGLTVLTSIKEVVSKETEEQSS